MGRLIRSADADADVYEIALFIARDSQAAADRLIDKFDKALNLISDFPRMGAIRDELQTGLRSYPIGDYLLIYRPIKDGIELVRVMHGMRSLKKHFSRD